ncbi:hypothetical protein C8D78_2943 [Arthrobacter oryzae]|uniref:Uncharacterized protein n=1 Tax=Arthrobacter oryzae TaxID=409290 RepID=A0A495EFV1_9MICC|nr:hypothetical protein C8D78_2943 [Arthrobacter oryzae]
MKVRQDSPRPRAAKTVPTERRPLSAQFDGDRRRLR